MEQSARRVNTPNPRKTTPQVSISSVENGRPTLGYVPIRLAADRGPVECRYYRPEGATRAAIWVGGAGGGWDSPHNLYPRLCRDLCDLGIASLRVRYRQPAVLAESVFDVLTGAAFLAGEGIGAICVTGWSFGGAVAIGAAAQLPEARAVVTLSTQSYGADPARNLPPACALLLLHGSGDRTLAPACSHFVFDLAHEPKELILFEGANHGLDQAAGRVYPIVREWILRYLAA